MEDLRKFYGPKTEYKQVHDPPRAVSNTDEFFNPVVAHRWAGDFPLMDPEKKVILDLEPAPTMLFQHSPTFAYRPDVSNVDVNLF